MSAPIVLQEPRPEARLNVAALSMALETGRPEFARWTVLVVGGPRSAPPRGLAALRQRLAYRLMWARVRLARRLRRPTMRLRAEAGVQSVDPAWTTVLLRAYPAPPTPPTSEALALRAALHEISRDRLGPVWVPPSDPRPRRPRGHTLDEASVTPDPQAALCEEPPLAPRGSAPRVIQVGPRS